MKYSIPRRENELRASGPSPVTVTQLTPEELEEVRRKYPATSKDRGFNKPIEIKPRPKGEEDMPKNTPPLREKEVTEQKPVSQELLDKAGEEIERLTADNQRLAEQVETRTMESKALRMRRDELTDELRKALAHVKERAIRIIDLEAERDRLIAEVNQLTDRVMELEEDVYRADVATRPAAESNVELLNSAIADLTRVRRIVQFLAAGE